MRSWLALLALLAWCGAAHADDEWSTSDKALGSAYASALAIDWAQTQGLRHHRYEINPILGRTPGSARVNVYFAASAATALLIANEVPSRYRPYLLGGMLAWEVSFVAHNYKLGVKCAW